MYTSPTCIRRVCTYLLHRAPSKYRGQQLCETTVGVFLSGSSIDATYGATTFLAFLWDCLAELKTKARAVEDGGRILWHTERVSCVRRRPRRAAASSSSSSPESGNSGRGGKNTRCSPSSRAKRSFVERQCGPDMQVSKIFRGNSRGGQPPIGTIYNLAAI